MAGLLKDADSARDARQLNIATELYKRYLDARPWAAGIWLQYAFCLRERGDQAAADRAYTKALRIRPWHARTCLLIGELRELQQRPGNALFWYQLAAALKPGLRDAHAEAGALEAQGIVPASEPFPVSWFRPLIPRLQRRYSKLAATAPRRVASSEAGATAGSSDSFEGAWRQYLPAFIEATSNLAALGHEYAKLRRDVDRLMRADAGSRGAGSAARPFIVNAEKVAAAAQHGPLCIILGRHGPAAAPDRIVIGEREKPGTDVVAEFGNLPFQTQTVDEIRAVRLFEQLRPEDLERRLLPYWLSLLKPGGSLVVIGVDGPGMIANVASGTIAFEDYRGALFDDGSGEGGLHNLFSGEMLSAMLERAGFRNIETLARAPSGEAALEFEISARAPGPGHDR